MYRQAGSTGCLRSSTQEAFPPRHGCWVAPLEPLCSLYLGSIQLEALGGMPAPIFPRGWSWDKRPVKWRMQTWGGFYPTSGLPKAEHPPYHGLSTAVCPCQGSGTRHNLYLVQKSLRFIKNTPAGEYFFFFSRAPKLRLEINPNQDGDAAPRIAQGQGYCVGRETSPWVEGPVCPPITISTGSAPAAPPVPGAGGGSGWG